MNDIENLRRQFIAELKSGQKTPAQLLKDDRLQALLQAIPQQPVDQRQAFGQAVNELKQFVLVQKQTAAEQMSGYNHYLDVTAPCDVNQAIPDVLLTNQGSVHPIFQAQTDLVNIFSRMGFTVVESRQLDSEFYMFDSLNFPAQHPARDEFDTFLLQEKDATGRPLLAPAHTSTMQNRVLRANKQLLEQGQPIACVIPGRVFRNEDVDASHDHMFYQLEGVFVSSNATVANLIATLKEAMSAYFQADLALKIQPFYFPFTEPSFEFAISCPFCEAQSEHCRICKGGWIELIGCGLIHPNVLKLANIDSSQYTGFAWGLGLNRLIMLKHGLSDIRLLTSGSVDFLQQFNYESQA